MVVNDALKIFKTKMKNVKIVRCFEYRTVFVFQFVPEKYDKTTNYDEMMNTLVSVNKKDKSVKPFLPIDISVDEYKNGTEVFLDKKEVV